MTTVHTQGLIIPTEVKKSVAHCKPISGVDTNAGTDNSLDELLAELLAEPREQMAARVAHEFDRIAAPFENRVVVFGAGYLGRLAVSGLKTAGIEPLAVCDNNSSLWGTQTEGVPVLSPAQAAAR